MTTTTTITTTSMTTTTPTTITTPFNSELNMTFELDKGRWKNAVNIETVRAEYYDSRYFVIKPKKVVVRNYIYNVNGRVISKISVAITGVRPLTENEKQKPDEIVYEGW